MAVIPVASKAGGPRDKLLTNTATGVLAAIRDHYLARMSALGHKRKWCYARVMSVLPLKADIRQGEWHVRYVPIADISNTHTFKHVAGYENQVANAS